jgi:ParB-like chromosome segregation protein Spo0J
MARQAISGPTARGAYAVSRTRPAGLPLDEIAVSILEKGLQAPIRVRPDGARFVLVEGLHRLEAAKALGEQTIAAFLVDAPKH